MRIIATSQNMINWMHIMHSLCTNLFSLFNFFFLFGIAHARSICCVFGSFNWLALNYFWLSFHQNVDNCMESIHIKCLYSEYCITRINLCQMAQNVKLRKDMNNANCSNENSNIVAQAIAITAVIEWQSHIKTTDKNTLFFFPLAK